MLGLGGGSSPEGVAVAEDATRRTRRFREDRTSLLFPYGAGSPDQAIAIKTWTAPIHCAGLSRDVVCTQTGATPTKSN